MALADVYGVDQPSRITSTMPIFTIGVVFGFIVEDDDFIKMIGFGLAAAVLFDAVIVRMTIVPALFALFARDSSCVSGD